MDKYKVGNKFVIEIEEIVNASANPYTLYKIKGFNSLVFDDNGLDKLKSLESCFIPESRSSEEIYNEGMDEGWELAKTIIGCSDKTYFTEDMLDEIFDTHNAVRIISTHSPQELKEKIKKYEKENIKVGDIVRYKSIQEEYINAIVVAIIKVSAKYSCGFPDPQVLPIIVVDRYLDYFTTIMEDRLWQVLAEPVSRWRNRSGLSMNAARAA